MRLPFLQMESDLIAHGAAEVAHLAGCPVALALGHIAMLRAWAVSAAGESAPPDGWVDGEAAGRRIEAAAQWTGERGRLLQALQDAGQVRYEDGGIRVLHLEPYVKAWEQNRTSKERMRKLRERSANAEERPAKFDGQTQTQTQTQTQRAVEDLAPPESAPRNELRLESQVAAKRTRATKREDKPTDPRHAPLCKALEAAGWPHHGGRTAKAVAELLALADRMPPAQLPPGDHPAVEEVLRRARLAMAHEGFPRVREVHELPRNWGHFESAPAPARGPAPPSDFSRPAIIPERSPFAPEVSDEPF